MTNKQQIKDLESKLNSVNPDNKFEVKKINENGEFVIYSLTPYSLENTIKSLGFDVDSGEASIETIKWINTKGIQVNSLYVSY